MQDSGGITRVNTIGERLRAEREVAGLTQGALAAKAGVSQGAIGNVEAGLRRQPRALLPIAEALGLNPSWLATGKGQKHRSAPDAADATPTLPAALPVVLDALAASPHRAELRSLLALLVDTDAPAYRARLAELLADGASGKHRNAA